MPLKQTWKWHNIQSLFFLSYLPPHPHSPSPPPSRRPGSARTLIRSCVLNPVVPASLNFHCYEDKGRYKVHRSPGSLHSTSFAHYCRHGNLLSQSPLDDPSHSVCRWMEFFFIIIIFLFGNDGSNVQLCFMFMLAERGGASSASQSAVRL